MPDDPRLGPFRVGLANTVALFEERPDDDESDAPQFGRSKKVYSTAKVLEKLQEDHDNRVDQPAVVRARLFDFFIGDWDRHEDQWRWASFEQESGRGKLYRPIPRDRDMTFFVNQGVIPNIASRRWIMPKIQGFDEGLRDVAGFNFNARYFDRTFLTELSLADWQAAARELQQRLTDETITAALQQLPAPVYQMRGEKLAALLRARRQRLVQDAIAYYQFLARAVDVVGSDKREFFEVVRQDNEHTRVTVYKISKENERKQTLYHRVFKTHETREVRLYGLAGDDVFTVRGQVQKGLLVRIIGGTGQDQITDSSRVTKGARKTIIYDTATGNQLHLAAETQNATSDRDPAVNEYNRQAFAYDYLGPLAALGYNKDDGFHLGGGLLLRTQGFRQAPFAASQRFLAHYALATESFLVNYAGYFNRAAGIFDVAVNLDGKTRNFSDNFFGLSNESAYNREFSIDYYRYRSQRYTLNVLLGRRWGNQQQFLFGPELQIAHVQPDPTRNLGQFSPAELSPRDPFARKIYPGFRLTYAFDSRDDRALPSRGVSLQTTATAHHGLGPAATDYARLHAELAVYRTVRLPFKVTLAGRVGGGTNFGDFEFFQASTLDGLYHVRGYRRSRFSGRSSFYHNLEARLRLFNFQTYLFPGAAGVMGFHDVGRVWNDNERSRQWHQGYGGGVWFAPVNLITITAGYLISDENRLPLISAGFLF